MSSKKEVGEKYALENFHLIKVKDIGEGAFGKVFLAIDAAGDPDVQKRKKHAVKVCVMPDAGSDKEFLMDYLLRELDLHKALRHRNVVMLFNGVSIPECTILDMEFCDMSLTDFSRKRYRGVLPENVFRKLARDTTRAIRFLHKNGIVHRDIKTDNVLLIFRNGNPDDFVAKLADFGFAKKEQDVLRTSLGSPVYEPPEVFTSSTTGRYSVVCDMWSLGIMYYELLTGRFPFRTSSREMIMYSICREDLIAFDLPSSCTASPSCKHFVRNHLFRDPALRCTSEEAYNHPFIMLGVCSKDIAPKVRVLNMAIPLTNKEFLQTNLCHEVEVGDLVWTKVQSSLGDEKLTYPHALKDADLTVTWADIAHFIKMDNDDLINQMMVICDGGYHYSASDVFSVSSPHDNDTACALLINSQTGIPNIEIRPRRLPPITEEEIKQAEAGDRSTVDGLNKYLCLCSKYLKLCSLLSSHHARIFENYADITMFLSTVVDFNEMSQEIKKLEKELISKRGKFPQVAFFAPVVEVPSAVMPTAPDAAVIQSIRGDLKSARNRAQSKVDEQQSDLTPEVTAVANVWEKNKSLCGRYQEGVKKACVATQTLMNAFCQYSEIFSRLNRYIAVLKKAKVATDVSSVYPELKELLQCDYLRISPEHMRLIGATTSVSSDAASPEQGDSRDNYINVMKEEINTLRKLIEGLKADQASLEEEKASVTAKAEETLRSLREIVKRLREELKAHGIPDPTEPDAE